MLHSAVMNHVFCEKRKFAVARYVLMVIQDVFRQDGCFYNHLSVSYYTYPIIVPMSYVVLSFAALHY